MNYQLKIKTYKKISWPVWLICLLIVLLSGCYLFFAKSLVVNAVKNNNIKTEVEGINLKLSELETEYVTLENEITLDKARTLGFQDANSEFIASAPLGKGVSMRNEI